MTIYTGYSTISRFQHLISEGFTIETKVYGKKNGDDKANDNAKASINGKASTASKASANASGIGNKKASGGVILPFDEVLSFYSVKSLLLIDAADAMKQQ